MNKLIDEYNATVNNEERIHPMYELTDVLLDYGYDEYDIEDIYSLDVINNQYFDNDDEYFWWSSNGYLYSGNIDDVIAVIGNSIDSIENNNNFYRYTINIDGEEYEFIHGIDILIEKGILDEDDKKVQRINALLSRMTTPEIRLMNENNRCYFTEKGKQYFSNVINQISNILKNLGYEVKEQIKAFDNFEKVDDYQVVAKRLLKMKKDRN